MSQQKRKQLCGSIVHVSATRIALSTELLWIVLMPGTGIGSYACDLKAYIWHVVRFLLNMYAPHMRWHHLALSNCRTFIDPTLQPIRPGTIQKMSSSIMHCTALTLTIELLA